MGTLITYATLLQRPVYAVFQDYIIPLVCKGRPRNRGAIFSICTAVALCGTYILHQKITTPPRALRNLPRGSFFLTNKAYIQKTANDFAKELSLPLALQSSSGMYVRLEAMGWTVHIARPEVAKHFLHNTDIFPKLPMAERGPTLESQLGHNNVLFVNGQKWKSQRMVVNPAFHRAMPIDLFAEMTSKLFGVIDLELNQGDPDIRDLTGRLALDIIGRAGFGFDFGSIEDSNSEWAVRYNSTCGQIYNPFFLVFPIFDTLLLPFFPARYKIHQELKKFIKKVDEIVINNKRKVLNQDQRLNKIDDHRKDLLTLMIEAGEDGSSTLSDDELRSNVILFLGAGHETTANAMAMTIYHLAVNQDVQKKAREQVLEFLGDTTENIAPTAEQSRGMTYINMIIKESLRINPPTAFTFPRIAAQDSELDGTFIPKGTPISLDIYDLQHNPTVWKDPETFDPQRFAPGGEAEQVGAGAWLPFLTGPRQCVGMNFTLAEQRVALAMFLRKYEWRLPSNSIHKEKLITTGKVFVGPKDLKISFKRLY